MKFYMNRHIFSFKEPVSERKERFCRYLKLFFRAFLKILRKCFGWLWLLRGVSLSTQQLLSPIAVVLLDLIVTTRMLGSLLYEYVDGKDYVTPKIQVCIFLRQNFCVKLITGLEREKRPLHNLNFEHFTSLFHRGRQRKKEKCEKCRNDCFLVELSDL